MNGNFRVGLALIERNRCSVRVAYSVIGRVSWVMTTQVFVCIFILQQK